MLPLSVDRPTVSGSAFVEARRPWAAHALDTQCIRRELRNHTEFGASSSLEDCTDGEPSKSKLRRERSYVGSAFIISEFALQRAWLSDIVYLSSTIEASQLCECQFLGIIVPTE
jgi:hypothetical protein